MKRPARAAFCAASASLPRLRRGKGRPAEKVQKKLIKFNIKLLVYRGTYGMIYS